MNKLNQQSYMYTQQAPVMFILCINIKI